MAYGRSTVGREIYGGHSPVPAPPPPPAIGKARVGDRTIGYCFAHRSVFGGTVVTGATNVLVNGRICAKEGSLVQGDCGHYGTAHASITDVQENAVGVVRRGDIFTGTYQGNILEGSTNVLAG